jgi:hypothetical protein
VLSLISSSFYIDKECDWQDGTSTVQIDKVLHDNIRIFELLNYLCSNTRFCSEEDQVVCRKKMKK